MADEQIPGVNRIKCGDGAECAYSEFVAEQIKTYSWANTTVAEDSRRVDDMNIAARRNGALRGLTRDAQLETMVCDRVTGCRLAMFCIAETVRLDSRHRFTARQHIDDSKQDAKMLRGQTS